MVFLHDKLSEGIAPFNIGKKMIIILYCREFLKSHIGKKNYRESIGILKSHIVLKITYLTSMIYDRRRDGRTERNWSTENRGKNSGRRMCNLLNIRVVLTYGVETM